jgi:hypothetical protein
MEVLTYDQFIRSTQYIYNLTKYVYPMLDAIEPGDLTNKEFDALVTKLARGKTRSIFTHCVRLGGRPKGYYRTYNDIILKLFQIQIPTQKQVDSILACIPAYNGSELTYEWLKYIIDNGYGQITPKQIETLTKFGYEGCIFDLVGDNNLTPPSLQNLLIILKSKCIFSDKTIITKYVNKHKTYFDNLNLNLNSLTITLLENKFRTQAENNNKHNLTQPLTLQILEILLICGFKPDKNSLDLFVNYQIIHLSKYAELLCQYSMPLSDHYFSKICSHMNSTEILLIMDIFIKYGYIFQKNSFETMIQNQTTYSESISKVLIEFLLKNGINPTYDTIVHACKTINIDLFDTCIKKDIYPDEKCLEIACSRCFEPLISRILDMKILPDENCLISLLQHTTNNTLFNMLVSNGACITYNVVEKLIITKKINYVNDFNEYGIKYDEKLFSLFSKYNEFPNDGILHKFTIDKNLMELRKLCYNRSNFDEIIKYKNEHNIDFDSYCYDQMLYLTNNDDFILNAIKIGSYKPTFESFLLCDNRIERITIYNKYKQYMTHNNSSNNNSSNNNSSNNNSSNKMVDYSIEKIDSDTNDTFNDALNNTLNDKIDNKINDDDIVVKPLKKAVKKSKKVTKEQSA